MVTDEKHPDKSHIFGKAAQTGLKKGNVRETQMHGSPVCMSFYYVILHPNFYFSHILHIRIWKH